MRERSITERENALRVLTRSGNPQWVPISDDCFQFTVSSAAQERPPFGVTGKDWFGCSWVWDQASFGHAPEVRTPPILDDITAWRDVVKFPDLEAVDWKSAAEKDLASFDKNEKLLRLFMESGPFERSHHLLGFENAFIAMAEEPDEYKALIDAIADYKVNLIEKLCEYYKPDEFFAHDDLGTANGPMISPDMYRRLIKPAHRRISEAIRSRGAIHTHHSCGKMEAFIDDLLDIGVQVINPVQPVNNQSAIARNFSDVVSFDVGAETVANYADAGEEEIRREVRRVIDTFGPGKNLILTCFVSNAACASNKDIVLDEARTYGSSFYKR